ncbi:MAG: hypothetical protein ACE5JI_10225, partial [Acidobacteriota bacterium]
FEGDLAAKYDVIVLPSGTSKERMVQGLSPARYDETWRWAYGAGEEGWKKLEQWVRQGGTLVAIGSAVETARDLLGLPIEKVLPEAPRRFRRRPEPGPGPAEPQIPRSEAERMLKEAFQSPGRLVKLMKDKVVDPTSVFYCPGSLLHHEYNTGHPVAYGMPENWPVFFRYDQAYRLRPSFDIPAQVVSRYPDAGNMVASGWLLGEELLRDQANVVAFEVGRGNVVTLGSQVEFRTQTRATFKLLFNAVFQGPAVKLDSRGLSRLSRTGGMPTGQEASDR